MNALARLFSPVRLYAAACLGALVWGYRTPLREFITPERGLGYTLGIVGGSMMLLVVIYPMRKRLQSMNFVGSVPFWFEMHMLLGTLGPILVLFHCNFSLGATNSNVALYCMLLVSGSGIIGRYFYGRVYDKLNGRQATLAELQGVADLLHKQTSTVAVLPDLLAAIQKEETWLLAPAHSSLGRLVHPFTIGARSVLARWHLRRFIRRAVVLAASQSPTIAAQAQRLAEVSTRYASRRLDAQRRVVEYRMYAGLFSYWHVLHVPLFIMLIIAGTVHIVSVNLY